MKSKILSRLGYSAIAYALAAVLTAAYALIAHGAEADIGALYFVELLALIVVVEAVDIACWYIFDKAALALVVGFVADLAAVIGLGVLFGWFAFAWPQLLSPILVTVVVYALVYWFSYARNRADVQKINERLRESRSGDAQE